MPHRDLKGQVSIQFAATLDMKSSADSFNKPLETWNERFNLLEYIFCTEPPILEHLYTEAMLSDAFSSMDIMECRMYEAEIKKGAPHVGMSALVGIVARKPTVLAR